MTAALSISRKQRLHALEEKIRDGMEAFYQTGMRLKEIRDDQLYQEAGFRTWEEYCRKIWDWSAERARQLIVASEYRAVLPSPTNVGETDNGSLKLTEAFVRELTRLPDKRDAAKVAAKVFKAVEQSAKEAAKDPEVKPLKPTAATARKFVDVELGIDRAAQGKETKRLFEKAEECRKQEQYEKAHPMLDRYLLDERWHLASIAKRLRGIDAESWQDFARLNRGAVQLFFDAVDDLASLRPEPTERKRKGEK